ncbi:DNA ligase D [Ureibacillus sp. MALMAid1270]|uniref:DNA ligase D n=1 Tax=Ureibacillus sp. MALMAid1270 TaxID=3411629 RepID=UPI003BA5725E
MKPMLLTATEEVPVSEDWLYEVKYDGYRCLLHWDHNGIRLISRNGNELTHLFPEITSFSERFSNFILPVLPIVLDGEICYLTNDYKSEFSIVQTRGKMRNEDVIQKNAQIFPCHFIAFDLIHYKGLDITQYLLIERKSLLKSLFETIGAPNNVQNDKQELIQAIDVMKDEQEVLEKVRKYNGEGIIAKRSNSVWNSGVRSREWLKIKNWRFVKVVLTKYDKENGYFHGSVYKDNSWIEVVIVKHGLQEKEVTTLVSFFQENGKQITSEVWELQPSICVEVACIDFDGKKLREPRFHQFRFDVTPEEANWRAMLRALNPIPEIVQITHPDKPVWPALNLVKDDYLHYLQQIATYQLPFLKDRLLTSIRFPHGVPGESFYQKNAPDYTPDFVLTKRDEDIDYIVCNNIETLLWLGNQLAIEFHIPFQTIDTEYPTEIVFDLDPPSVNEFSLAIDAALKMKEIFDQFQLQSFVKTSGGKGLQIYIPLPKNTFSYEDTRIFTEFVCMYLCMEEPNKFTTERLKKNRHGKLYLDYIQHAEGKTIVAPYSARGNDLGCIATPLFWEEVNGNLRPDLFTIPTVLERIKKVGDPFLHFREVGEQQDFEVVLTNLKLLINGRNK